MDTIILNQSVKEDGLPYEALAKYGAPRRSRTPNLQIRSLTLCPVELWARDFQENIVLARYSAH